MGVGVNTTRPCALTVAALGYRVAPTTKWGRASAIAGPVASGQVSKVPMHGEGYLPARSLGQEEAVAMATIKVPAKFVPHLQSAAVYTLGGEMTSNG